MNILIHVCCAPCLIHPFRELSKDNKNSVTGFFYNPNIHPYTEMKARLDEVYDYAPRLGANLVEYEYDMENFFKALGGEAEAPRRCRICWRMRLRETGAYAKEHGFDAFTSTLLVSPYQDRNEIARIGSEIGMEMKINFIDTDWRSGFREAQETARQSNMYRQKYCGCLFSERERFSKKKK